MHLLTSYINQVLLMTSLFVLMTFALNHVIDEWRRRRCLTLKTDILKVAYKTYNFTAGSLDKLRSAYVKCIKIFFWIC